MRILGLLLGALLLGANHARAQLTAAQALDRRRLDELVVSPNGRLAAFTVSEPARGTEHARHVFLYRRGDSTVAQFTRSEKSEWSPRFSPDGTELAFLSDRGERTGIWIARIDGGEARSVPTGKIAVD